MNTDQLVKLAFASLILIVVVYFLIALLGRN